MSFSVRESHSSCIQAKREIQICYQSDGAEVVLETVSFGEDELKTLSLDDVRGAAVYFWKIDKFTSGSDRWAIPIRAR